MNKTDDSSNRINELISELSNCREDERNSQNQILQTIVTAGTILGILLGSSYFSNSKPDYVEATFWLSIFVFCAAFTYIVTLGTGNVLRYYYIQELEDRLHKLIPQGDDDSVTGNVFIHWGSFSGPIITRNPHHITSAYTALHFLNYSIAAVCAVAFSMKLIFFQYSKIKSKTEIDAIGIAGAFILMMIVLGLFLATSVLAKEMVCFTRKTALHNLDCRINGYQAGMYNGTKEFFRMFRYFLYPKWKDRQKLGLIFLGCVGGLIWTYENVGLQQDLWGYTLDLLYVLFCFDFLAYQARFQINDIRGVEEANSRLRDSSGEIVPEYLQLSLVIALVKIGLAVVMAFRGDAAVRSPLVISLIGLLLITILYEIARTKQSQKWIYFLVGAGYPLRFFLGLIIAIPQSYRLELLCNPKLVLGAAAFWAYGMSSAIMSWANEVIEKMKHGEDLSNHPKKHYYSLQQSLDPRYQSALKHKIGQKFFPLRECGKIGDAWESSYIIALSCFGVIMSGLVPVAVSNKVIEILTIICFLAMIPCKYGTIRLLYYAGTILTAANVIMVLGGLEYSLCYAFAYLIQFMFAATYYILRYTPQFKPLHLKHLALVFFKMIIGQKAFENFFRKKGRKSGGGCEGREGRNTCKV